MSRIEAMLKQLQTFLEQVLNREQLSSTGWEGSKIEHTTILTSPAAEFEEEKTE